MRFPRTKENELMPWLPSPCIKFLTRYLNKGMNGFEYGSGGSTLFFSRLTNGLVSVENDLFCHNDIKNMIMHRKVDNILLILEQGINAYPRRVDCFADDFFNYILIDGLVRNVCVRQSYRKLKPGGILILDNSERPNYNFTFDLLNGWAQHNFFPDGKEYKPGERGWKCTIFTKPLPTKK